MIAVLDSGFGNVRSALAAFGALGLDADLVADPRALAKAQRVVFPGVGSWGAVMSRLRERALDEALIDFISTGRPFLGICMGLQVLFASSEEDEGAGLGLLEGSVVKFRAPKTPQIGWNLVEPAQSASPAVPRGYFYFINSFHARPNDSRVVAANANYMGEEFVAAVERENILAVQFHPEKSARAGLELLRRWSKS